MQRFSPKRAQILDTLRAGNHHSAEWIFQELKPRIPRLSLATVYRNLNAFEQRGDILNLGVINGFQRFDGRANPHSHFICTQCGGILDILDEDESVTKQLKQNVEDALNVSVIGHWIQYQGLCDQCKSMAADDGSAIMKEEIV
jgi:Fur family peroxide stress response transcriptional regulator